MTQPLLFQEPNPPRIADGASSGSDSRSRSRTHVGRARERSRRSQGWCPRLRSVPVETGEKPSGLVGASRGSACPAAWACWRPESSDRSDPCNMMTPTTAQADHY